MTFNDFVKNIAEENGISNDQSRKLIKSIFNNIKDIVSVGDNILVPNFARFDVVKKNSRVGTNLVTGERVPIPPKIAVKFTPTEALKKSVDK
jgi:nucleoid DNA-binding protein